MAVKIKLMRLGKIRQPHYRIVVAPAQSRRDGKVIETIGKYNPKQQPSFIQVDSDRAQYWLGVGARPTEPVQNILQVTGDWQKFKGLPGSEGTLRQPEPKPDKAERFARALAEAGEEPTIEAATARRRGGPRQKAASAATSETPDGSQTSGDSQASQPTESPEAADGRA